MQNSNLKMQNDKAKFKNDYRLMLTQESSPEFASKAEILLAGAKGVSKMLGFSVLTMKGRKEF